MEGTIRVLCQLIIFLVLAFNVIESLRCRFCAGQLHDSTCNDTYLCQDQEYCYRANYFWDGYKWAVWGCVDGFQIEDDEICGHQLYKKNPRRDKCEIFLCNNAHECNSAPPAVSPPLILLSVSMLTAIFV